MSIKYYGFDNPSIYCREIVEIISHIQNQILKEMPIDIVNRIGIVPMNYKEIIEWNENRVII